MLWRYANGIDDSPVNPWGTVPKGIGNSLTTLMMWIIRGKPFISTFTY